MNPGDVVEEFTADDRMRWTLRRRSVHDASTRTRCWRWRSGDGRIEVAESTRTDRVIRTCG